MNTKKHFFGFAVVTGAIVFASLVVLGNLAPAELITQKSFAAGAPEITLQSIGVSGYTVTARVYVSNPGDDTVCDLHMYPANTGYKIGYDATVCQSGGWGLLDLFFGCKTKSYCGQTLNLSHTYDSSPGTYNLTIKSTGFMKGGGSRWDSNGIYYTANVPDGTAPGSGGSACTRTPNPLTCAGDNNCDDDRLLGPPFGPDRDDSNACDETEDWNSICTVKSSCGTGLKTAANCPSQCASNSLEVGAQSTGGGGGGGGGTGSTGFAGSTGGTGGTGSGGGAATTAEPQVSNPRCFECVGWGACTNGVSSNSCYPKSSCPEEQYTVLTRSCGVAAQAAPQAAAAPPVASVAPPVASVAPSVASVAPSVAGATPSVITAIPTIASFTANGQSGTVAVPNGTAVTVDWSATNATRCSAAAGSSGWRGNSGVSGPFSAGVLAPGTYVYVLQCHGEGGSSLAKSVTVTVQAMAAAMGRAPGELWPEYAGAPAPGEMWPEYAGTQASQPLTVQTPAPTVNIKANGNDGPISVKYNGSARLSWTSKNTTDCTVTPGDWTALSRTSQATGALTASTDYTITCDGAGGTATDMVRVNVLRADPPSVVGFKADGKASSAVTVKFGASPEIVWKSSLANSCAVTALPDGGTAGATVAVESDEQGVYRYSVDNARVPLTVTVGCTGPGGASAPKVTRIVPQAPTLTVTAPAKNERWNFDREYKLGWRSSGLDLNVVSLYLVHPEANFSCLLAKDVPATPASKAYVFAKNGACLNDAALTVTAREGYRVKIYGSANGAASDTAYDVQDASDFSFGLSLAPDLATKLQVSADASRTVPSVIVPGSAQPLMNVKLQNRSASKSIVVKELSFTDTISAGKPSLMAFSAMRLDDIGAGTSFPIADFTEPASSGPVRVRISIPGGLVIPANSVKTFTLFGEVNSEKLGRMDGSSHRWNLAAKDIVATNDNEQSIKIDGTVFGPFQKLSSTGSVLTLGIPAGKLSPASLLPGKRNVRIFSVSLANDNLQPVAVTRIDITGAVGNNRGSASSFANLKLRVGTAQVGVLSGALATDGATALASFVLAKPLAIPQGKSKILDLYADVLGAAKDAPGTVPQGAVYVWNVASGNVTLSTANASVSGSAGGSAITIGTVGQ